MLKVCECDELMIVTEGNLEWSKLYAQIARFKVL